MIWEAKHLVPGCLSWRSERFVEAWVTKMQSGMRQMESVGALFFMTENFSMSKTYL